MLLSCWRRTGHKISQFCSIFLITYWLFFRYILSWHLSLDGFCYNTSESLGTNIIFCFLLYCWGFCYYWFGFIKEIKCSFVANSFNLKHAFEADSCFQSMLEMNHQQMRNFTSALFLFTPWNTSDSMKTPKYV